MSKEQKKTLKKKTKKKPYFGQDVQNSIVKYQKTDLREDRNKIYEVEIYPALNELVQSLVSVYGFKSSSEDIDHLKSDCISFLFETLHKWSPDKGTKAFSYFNVVAKNWLTINSRRLLKNQRRSVYLDDQENLNNSDKSQIYDEVWVDPEETENERKIFFKRLIDIINFIEDQIKDENDQKCVLAIRKIFDSIDDIEFFNKRAVFVYMREISGLNSTELSSSLSSIRKIYRKNVGQDKKFILFDIE